MITQSLSFGIFFPLIPISSNVVYRVFLFPSPEPPPFQLHTSDGTPGPCSSEGDGLRGPVLQTTITDPSAQDSMAARLTLDHQHPAQTEEVGVSMYYSAKLASNKLPDIFDSNRVIRVM